MRQSDTGVTYVKKVDSEHEDSGLDESDSQTGSEPEREQGPRRSSRNLRQQ